MTFGTPIIKLKRRKGGGPPPRRYDCGEHGRLTVREIALRAGICKKAAQQRVNLGWRGERLCLTKWATKSEASKYRAPAPPNLRAMYVLAMKYPNRPPTLDEIKAARPMSHANAQTWRGAIIAARRQMGLAA